MRGRGAAVACDIFVGGWVGLVRSMESDGRWRVPSIDEVQSQCLAIISILLSVRVSHRRESTALSPCCSLILLGERLGQSRTKEGYKCTGKG